MGGSPRLLVPSSTASGGNSTPNSPRCSPSCSEEFKRCSGEEKRREEKEEGGRWRRTSTKSAFTSLRDEGEKTKVFPELFEVNKSNNNNNNNNTNRETAGKERYST